MELQQTVERLFWSVLFTASSVAVLGMVMLAGFERAMSVLGSSVRSLLRSRIRGR